ncbi:MAG: hypothetical protein HY716_09855 [Planctomycetes bacterium]|nr:hypothetical protein [Planctomycetota bacterium]
MSNGSARIESMEVLKDFRNQFVAFDKRCRNALIGLDSEIKRMAHWLRGEQLLHWKVQLRKCEEAVNRASSELMQARIRSSYAGKSSYVDERKALEKAKRRKEEAEAKIIAIKLWSNLLEQNLTKMEAPCNSLGILLDQLIPKGLARIDRMLDSLDQYFRADSGEGP